MIYNLVRAQSWQFTKVKCLLALNGFCFTCYGNALNQFTYCFSILFLLSIEIHTRTEADRTHACPVCFKKFFTSKSSRSHFLKAHTTKRMYFSIDTFQWLEIVMILKRIKTLLFVVNTLVRRFRM